jgi:hypothetical protein
MPKSVRFLLPVLSAAALLLSLGQAGLQAAPARKGPASKIYIADVEGRTIINNGERIEDLTTKTTIPAQGAIFESKAGSTSTMVFSNGTGFMLGERSQIEVKRFQQEPFVPNRSDNEVEPSVSSLLVYVSRGTVALCTSKLVAGSSMNFSTPQAYISIRGRRVLIETDETTTKVSLIEGDVTVRGGGVIDMGGTNLQPGQQAVIRQGSPGSPAAVEVRSIPSEDRNRVENHVTTACMARGTVYFDVTAQQADGQQQLTVTTVTPPQLPTGATVSNAVIQ